MENALAIAIIGLLTQAVIVLGVHLKNISQDEKVKRLENDMVLVKGHHDECEREVTKLRELIRAEGHRL